MAPLVGLIVGPVFDVIGKIIDRVVPDKNAAEKAKLEMFQLAQTQEFQASMEQIKVNAAEAASGSPYAAGWRPTIGYICAAGLAYNYIAYPLLLWLVAASGSPMTPPGLFDGALMELVLGMLGLGALRSFEKVKGVA
jgi:hypothetical protein